MTAFRAAVDLGYRYLELDVRTSRDGVPMVFHDESLDRVTDGSGKLSDHTAAELARVRIGGTEPIPTAARLLAEWPEARLNIDVKDAAGAAALAGLIEQFGAHERVLVASFSELRRLRLLRLLRRPVASSGGAFSTALLVALAPFGPRTGARMARIIARLGRFQCVQVPERRGRIPVVTPSFVRRCHDARLQVHVWTVNDPSDMDRLLDLGVDGIITDRADLLAEVLARRAG